jgi:hypothetical protein
MNIKSPLNEWIISFAYENCRSDFTDLQKAITACHAAGFTPRQIKQYLNGSDINDTLKQALNGRYDGYIKMHCHRYKQEATRLQKLLKGQ